MNVQKTPKPGADSDIKPILEWWPLRRGPKAVEKGAQPLKR
jgi:hypothetical protein